ncbi:MAG TPA: PilN domain-containing protein [Candidatus Paceibacterota bacterium]|nr:PilN domain-containing protein [Candidatus Paceibacterota bacterium]
MDPQVGASFIPKKPLVSDRSGRGRSFGLLTLLCVLIFIASLLSAVGAFLYQGYLNTSLAAKKASLEKYEGAYDLPTIQTLVRFDSRINSARNVLQNHLAPSAIFFFLAQQTLERVQLTSFDFTVGDDGTAIISMNGLANSFSTIALQSDQLGASKVLKDVVFSNISVEPEGKVSFSVTATVDPSLYLYSKTLGSNTILPAESGTTTPPQE